MEIRAGGIRFLADGPMNVGGRQRGLILAINKEGEAPRFCHDRATGRIIAPIESAVALDATAVI